MRFLLLLISAFASTALGTEIDGAWGKPVNGLMLQVHPTKGAFKPSDEITLKFTVVNVTEKEIWFFKGNLWHFVDLNAGGKWVRRADFATDWDMKVDRKDFVLLAPRRTWESELNVTRNWLPEQPLASGKMKARYQNPNFSGRGLGLDAWTGTLDSWEFELAIK